MSYEEHPQDKELQQALSHFKDGSSLATEWLMKINVGAYQEPRPPFLRSGLEKLERKNLIDLLRS